MVDSDVSQLKVNLDKYLTRYSEENGNSWKAKPMDLGHLKVIALVQNDQTREIIQAAMFDVEGK